MAIVKEKTLFALDKPSNDLKRALVRSSLMSPPMTPTNFLLRPLWEMIFSFRCFLSLEKKKKSSVGNSGHK